MVSGALLGVVASSVPLSGDALQPPTASAFMAEWTERVEPAARERELATPAPASSQSGVNVALVGAVAAMGVAVVVAVAVWRARKRGTSVDMAVLRRGLEQALQEAQAAFERAYPLLGQSEPLTILAQYGGSWKGLQLKEGGGAVGRGRGRGKGAGLQPCFGVMHKLVCFCVFVCREDVKVGRVLGQGRFGTVYEVCWRCRGPGAWMAWVFERVERPLCLSVCVCVCVVGGCRRAWWDGRRRLR